MIRYYVLDTEAVDRRHFAGVVVHRANRESVSLRACEIRNSWKKGHVSVKSKRIWRPGREDVAKYEELL